MSNNINRKAGGGPWLLDLEEDLEPGDFEVFNLREMRYNGRKGYFTPWLPVDTVMIKNLDAANPLEATYNGQFGTIIEPNAADSYNDVGILRFRLENRGTGTISSGDVVIQVAVDQYGADDQALEEAQRHPLEKAARSLVGL